jgi:hypothetical protein
VRWGGYSLGIPGVMHPSAYSVRCRCCSIQSLYNSQWVRPAHKEPGVRVLATLVSARRGGWILTGGSDSCDWLVSSFFVTGGVKDARHTLIMHPSPMFKLSY